MEWVTVNGRDFIQIQSLAENLGVCTATVYNWRRAGQIDFCWPLGKVLTFVDRKTAERLMRLKITAGMSAFLKNIEN